MLQQTKEIKSNVLRRLSRMLLIIMCTILLSAAAWAQSLESGIYTISNAVSHDNPVGQGMARSYTEEIADIEVNDSGTFVTLGFNNTQYMGDFTISIGGSKVSYETSMQANNVKRLKFKVPGLSSGIKVGMYVQPMDTTVEYTVTLNESSLKLIKKAEAEAETPQNAVGSIVNGAAANSSGTNSPTENKEDKVNSTNTSDSKNKSTSINTGISKQESAAGENADASTQTAKKSDEAVAEKSVAAKKVKTENQSLEVKNQESAETKDERVAEELNQESVQQKAQESNQEEAAEESVKEESMPSELTEEQVQDVTLEVQADSTEAAEAGNEEIAGRSLSKRVIAAAIFAAAAMGIMICLKRK